GTSSEADDWGAIYLVDLSFQGSDEPTAEILILHDGNDWGDEGIRSPDNLDWSEDGIIYVQEDKALSAFGLTSGRDSSIVRIDPVTGLFESVAVVANTEADWGSLSTGRAYGLGDWEPSGVLDVARLFGLPDGSTLLLGTVQASTLTGGAVAESDLVQGGQILWITDE
ncbi:MAG: hypothetical protein ACR2OI_04970, partial [Acidimicrobiia bacterium]